MNNILSSLIYIFSVFTVNAQYSIFNYNGIDREYIYYEPSVLNSNAPLIFVMHGYTDDASTIESYSGFNAIADTAGFSVCYPRGTNDFLGNRFFNVGYDFHLGIETVDDQGFLEALAVYLQTTHGLDPNRIYATGLSNGGDMCYKIACQGTGVFKAIAPVAGMILQDIKDNCTNNIPIPIMEIHGTADNVTFYDGDINNTGGWGAYPAIDEMIEFFANKNSYTYLQSENLPNIDINDGSTVTSFKYSNPSNCNDVLLYKINGGGHDWPGSFGNMDINSSLEIWKFYESTYCNVLSTIKNTSKLFEFSPNPFNEILNLKISEKSIIELFNNDGRIIKKIICSEQSISLDLSELQSGIYFLSCKTNKQRYIRKLIKE